MSNIRSLLNQALSIMSTEISTSKEPDEAWLSLIIDVIYFGDAVGKMADEYQIGVRPEDKKISPEDYTADIIKNLFKPKEEDNE